MKSEKKTRAQNHFINRVKECEKHNGPRISTATNIQNEEKKIMTKKRKINAEKKTQLNYIFS